MINNETFYVDKIESNYDFFDDENKLPKFIKKILSLFYIFTNKIIVKKIQFDTSEKTNIEDIKLVLLPVKNIDNINSKKLNKIVLNLIKRLKEYPVNNIVLSDELEAQESLKNSLYSNNFNVLNGRWLFKYVSEEILEYIFSIQKTKFEKEEISILINENSDINIEIIKSIATKCKVLNIVTNDIESFKFIEKYLNDEYGVLVNLTSNFRKGILKSNVVLNFDFPAELLNKCSFSRYALIINFDSDIKIYSKTFDGVNVNFYKISIPQKYKNIAYNLNHFKEEVLYESFIYCKRRYNLIRKMILEDRLKVRELIGIKGKIKIEEILRVKNLQKINPKVRKSHKRLDKMKY